MAANPFGCPKASSLLTALALAACGATALAASPGPNDPHRGGKLRLLASAGAGTIDPQINYTLQLGQIFQGVYDGLLAYKKAPGAEAFTVVPDLAEALPVPENGGKRYVFKIRQGVKFSNGRELTVDDVVASMRRIFKVSSPTSGTFYNLIIGADTCLKTPATCTLAGGVVADAKARTVTINLTEPDGEFFQKMAFTHSVILPAETPAKDVGVAPIPGTGPYRIAAYDPKKQLKLVRNPHFKLWSEDAQPDGYVDEVDYDFGLSDKDQVNAIANGQADWMYDPVPAERLGELSGKYPQQLHISPMTSVIYLAMNTRLAPFDNLKVRQAVNLAIDRNALVKIYGGPRLGRVTCQVLPPGIPGYDSYCPFTAKPGTSWSAPDLARARQLIKESGTAGQKVTLIVNDIEVMKQMGTYLQSVLNDLGFQTSLKPLSSTIVFTYVQNTNNQVQVSLTDWYQDYPTPSNFLNVLYSCASFRPGSDASINISGVCDKALDAEMNKALLTGLTDLKAAAAMWAAIDRKVTDSAAAANLLNPNLLNFTSRRLGNYVSGGQLYFIFTKAWVK